MEKKFLMKFKGNPYYTEDEQLLMWKSKYIEWKESKPTFWAFFLVTVCAVIACLICSYVCSSFVLWGVGVIFSVVLIINLIFLLEAYYWQNFYKDYRAIFLHSEEFKTQEDNYRIKAEITRNVQAYKDAQKIVEVCSALLKSRLSENKKVLAVQKYLLYISKKQ